MVKWMCGVSLKDRKLGLEMFMFLGNSFYVSCGEAGAIGNREHKSVEDCRNIEVVGGMKGKGRTDW